VSDEDSEIQPPSAFVKKQLAKLRARNARVKMADNGESNRIEGAAARPIDLTPPGPEKPLPPAYAERTAKETPRDKLIGTIRKATPIAPPPDEEPPAGQSEPPTVSDRIKRRTDALELPDKPKPHQPDSKERDIEAIDALYDGLSSFHQVPKAWLFKLSAVEAIMLAEICFWHRWRRDDTGKKHQKFRWPKWRITQKQLGTATNLSRFGAGKVLRRLKKAGYVDYKDIGHESEVWVFPEKIAELFALSEKSPEPNSSSEETNRSSDELKVSLGETKRSSDELKVRTSREYKRERESAKEEDRVAAAAASSSVSASPTVGFAPRTPRKPSSSGKWKKAGSQITSSRSEDDDQGTARVERFIQFANALAKVKNRSLKAVTAITHRALLELFKEQPPTGCGAILQMAWRMIGLEADNGYPFIQCINSVDLGYFARNFHDLLRELNHPVYEVKTLKPDDLDMLSKCMELSKERLTGFFPELAAPVKVGTTIPKKRNHG
jgi:hypothetical protein